MYRLPIFFKLKHMDSNNFASLNLSTHLKSVKMQCFSYILPAYGATFETLCGVVLYQVLATAGAFFVQLSSSP